MIVFSFERLGGVSCRCSVRCYRRFTGRIALVDKLNFEDFVDLSNWHDLFFKATKLTVLVE